MAEYIERDKAIDACFDGWNNNAHDCAENIRAIPAADVRPVVTCADCKYNTREVTDLIGNSAIQCITGLTHRHDWFCADGKKREES